MSFFNYKYKIKYSDIGITNKLTLKALLAILQEAATEHSDAAGYSINNIEQTHCAWLVLNWKVQMFLEPHLNEILTIKTWPRTFEKMYSYRDFEVLDSNNNLVAIASSKWLLIDAITKKIKKMTPEISVAYGGIEEKQDFDVPMQEKIIPPEDSKLNLTYTIQRRDLDTNKHVNNLHYLEFAFETLPEEIYNNSNFKNLEIFYKKEIKYKENINCYYSFENNKNIITIKNNDNSVLHAVIELY